MARTRTQLRQLTARQVGLDVYQTGTADSGGSTTTLKDSILQLWPNDYFNSAWIYLTSGSPSHTSLYVEDFVQGTGVATFRPTLSVAPDALTYEILPFSPTHIHTVISDVLVELAQEHVLEREFFLRSIVIGSPAYNAGFDYWPTTATIDGYTVASSTVVKEQNSANIAISRQSAKVTTGAGTVTVAEPYRRYFREFISQNANMYCWALTSTASSGRINLYDGSNNYSSYHSGGGLWELLSVENVDVGTTTVDIYPQFVMDTNNIVYFADWWVEGGEKPYVYPFPIRLMTDIDEITYGTEQLKGASPDVWLQQKMRKMGSSGVSIHRDAAADSDIGLLRLGENQPPISTRLFIRGRGPLSIPSTDTDYIEVTASQALIVAKRAAIKLLESLGVLVGSSQWRQVRERIIILRNDLSLLEEDSTNIHAAVLPRPHFG